MRLRWFASGFPVCFLWEICELNFTCTELVQVRSVLRFICPSPKFMLALGDDDPFVVKMEEVRTWTPLDVVVANQVPSKDLAEQELDQCLLRMHPIFRLLPDH